MKFCYLDESGCGNESIFVMAGVIVDAARMHRTKSDWQGLLDLLSETTGREVREFHTREFYRGKGRWWGFDGAKRAVTIDVILRWIGRRKHHFTFSAIDKRRFSEASANGANICDLPSIWCAGAVHCLLGIQKHHQTEKRNKGHTVVVFDREVKEEKQIAEIALAPPVWTREYYSKNKSQQDLDQLIDVPYFADSEHALLVQIADLVAYVLRLYGELEEGLRQESYTGERQQVARWVDGILSQTIPQSNRYPKKSRCAVAQEYWDIAPASLRK